MDSAHCVVILCFINVTSRLKEVWSVSAAMDSSPESSQSILSNSQAAASYWSRHISTPRTGQSQTSPTAPSKSLSTWAYTRLAVSNCTVSSAVCIYVQSLLDRKAFTNGLTLWLYGPVCTAVRSSWGRGRAGFGVVLSLQLRAVWRSSGFDGED